MPDDTTPNEIDTMNKFFVGKQGDEFVFLRPIPQRISDEDAMLLAAFIVAMCADEDRWQRILTAVKST